MSSLDFISAQADYWDISWQNRHHFVSELSKAHKVFFLSPPFYVVDLLRGTARTKTKLYGLSMLNRNLYSYVPPRYMPINYRFKGLDNMIRLVRHAKVRRELSKLRFSRPVLYIWHPNCLDLIGQFGESLVVYHKYDNYAGYFGGSGNPDPREAELIKKADLFFVTSRGLYDLHKEDRGDIHIVPNGVDYDFFSKDMSEIPEDIAGIPEPRIGYVGVINEKVDFDLLAYLCDSRPNWSIVLVGPEKVTRPEFSVSLKRLKEKRNCYFLGQKDIAAVPSYMRALNVCMMCYLVNDWTYYGYPLKMHEYLACGKPVLSADLPAVREFEGVVKIPCSKVEWLDLLDQYITKGDSQTDILGRLEVAKQNSWAVRIETIVALIKDKLGHSVS